MSNLLVILAHPDDAAIFCGGTILNYLGDAKSVYFCSITKPKSKNEEAQSKESFSLLKCPYEFLWLKSANQVIPDKLIDVLSGLIREHEPDQIITHWEKDTHPGHVRTLQATQIAITKNIIESNGKYPRELFACNTYFAWGHDRTPFPPTEFIKITAHWETKIESIKCFKNQWTDNWVKMVNVMDRLNGFRCGEEYAETFLKLSTLSSLNGGERSKPFL